MHIENIISYMHLYCIYDVFETELLLACHCFNQFIIGRWGCSLPHPFLLHSMLNKGKLVQSFCGQMCVLLPTSGNCLVWLHPFSNH